MLLCSGIDNWLWGPPVIIAKLFQYLVTVIQNTIFLSVKLHPVQETYNKFLYSIYLGAPVTYAPTPDASGPQRLHLHHCYSYIHIFFYINVFLLLSRSS